MEKCEILETIKRLANQNGGKPPGQKLFRSETGLGESQWRPKYWLRWGDALIEAGYSPNNFNSKYVDEVLIGKLIEISRELGRFPIEGELSRRRTTDPSFPSRRAFKTFGDKTTRAKRVYDYCYAHKDFDDVIPMCLEVISSLQNPIESDSTGSDRFGFVYLVRHGSRREYKIGRTNNLLRREGEIGIELPERVTPVHTIKTDDSAGVERYWHQRFADKRKNGEWFELTAQDVQAFKRWKRIF